MNDQETTIDTSRHLRKRTDVPPPRSRDDELPGFWGIVKASEICLEVDSETLIFSEADGWEVAVCVPDMFLGHWPNPWYKLGSRAGYKLMSDREQDDDGASSETGWGKHIGIMADMNPEIFWVFMRYRGLNPQMGIDKLDNAKAIKYESGIEGVSFMWHKITNSYSSLGNVSNMAPWANCIYRHLFCYPAYTYDHLGILDLENWKPDLGDRTLSQSITNADAYKSAQHLCNQIRTRLRELEGTARDLFTLQYLISCDKNRQIYQGYLDMPTINREVYSLVSRVGTDSFNLLFDVGKHTISLNRLWKNVLGFKGNASDDAIISQLQESDIFKYTFRGDKLTARFVSTGVKKPNSDVDIPFSEFLRNNIWAHNSRHVDFPDSSEDHFQLVRETLCTYGLARMLLDCFQTYIFPELESLSKPDPRELLNSAIVWRFHDGLPRES